MTSASAGSAAPSGNRESAKRYYAEKRWSEAIREYDRLVDACDENDTLAIFYSNRSACYMQLNNATLALRDAELCKAQKPAWSKSYTRMGSALLVLRRNKDAVHAFEKALELETGDKTEIMRNLAQARQRAGMSAPGSDYDAGGGVGMGEMNFSEIYGNVMGRVNQYVGQAMSMFHMASQQQKYMVYAAIAMLVYKIYSWLTRPSYADGGIYLDDLDYGGHGGGHYGLSWSMWAMVMGAAWKIPPMLGPQLLGDYARPFFGLSFTTFMWLLNMLTSGQRFGGGGGGLGGMFGGRGRGRRY